MTVADPDFYLVKDCQVRSFPQKVFDWFFCLLYNNKISNQEFLIKAREGCTPSFSERYEIKKQVILFT